MNYLERWKFLYKLPLILIYFLAFTYLQFLAGFSAKDPVPLLRGNSSPQSVILYSIFLLSLKGDESDRICEENLRSLLSPEILEELNCYRGERCYSLEVLCGRIEEIQLIYLKLRRSMRSLYIYEGSAKVLYWDEGNLVKISTKGFVALLRSQELNRWLIYKVKLLLNGAKDKI